MPYLFSPSELAFFHTDVPYMSLPADTAEVADDVHEAIMEAVLLGGKIIKADGDGSPMAGDPAGISDSGGGLPAVPNSAHADQLV